MKINFKQPMKDFSGNEMRQEVSTDGDVKIESILISSPIINALMAAYKDDDKCSGEDKLKRFDISKKISESEGAIELSTDEISFIKNYVNKAGFPPLTYARINEVLEGK
jgi:hypothetical protein